MLSLFCQDRSEVIATYALCGFANISAMGVMLGGLGSLAEGRKSDMAKLVTTALLAGNIACFMTAAISGENNIFMKQFSNCNQI